MEGVTHHILLYSCDKPLDDSVHGLGYICYDPESNKHPAIDDLMECNAVTFGWAIGGQVRCPYSRSSNTIGCRKYCCFYMLLNFLFFLNINLNKDCSKNIKRYLRNYLFHSYRHDSQMVNRQVYTNMYGPTYFQINDEVAMYLLQNSYIVISF